MMVASFKIEVHNIERLYSTRMRIKKTCEQYVHQLEQTIHSEKAIATKILPASTFTKQKNIIKILQKNPERYAQEQQDRANYKSN